MTSRLQRVAVIAAVIVFAGCAQVPKQAFNREAATQMKTLVITQNPNQAVYGAVIIAHPGNNFGLIGGLIAAADQQSKSKRLTDAIDPAETRLQDRFSAKLTESLQRAGYETSIYVLPAGIRDDDIVAAVKPKVTADAIVVVNLTSAYLSAGANSDYFPRVTAAVRVADLKSGAVLYRDVINYGYVQQNSKTINFPSDDKYRFPNFGDLLDDPAKTRAGLLDGLDPLANQIADDLKRN